MLCLLTTLQIVPSLHPTARHVLYVFFQPVAPPLLMLWLWGAAVKRFAALNVDYETCFAARDRRFLLSGEEIQKVGLFPSMAGLLLALPCSPCVHGMCAMSRDASSMRVWRRGRTSGLHEPPDPTPLMFPYLLQIALVLWSIALSLVASFTAAAYLQAYMAAELLPFFMYIGLALVVMLPLPILHRSSRNFFVNTCQRVLLPLQVQMGPQKQS